LGYLSQDLLAVGWGKEEAVQSLRGPVIVMLALVMVGSRAEGRPITFAHAKTFKSGVSNPGCVAVGDLNGDGYPDLVVTNHMNSVAVFLGEGGGAFKPPVLYTLDFYVEGCAAVADFNRDHKLDLVVVGGNVNGYSLAVLIGKGDGTFAPPRTSLLP
jgi:hypothetical protein